MSSPEERQPGLVTPEDSKVRMAGLENLVDTPQKRMKAVVLTGLTGVLAMEAFSVAAQAEPGEVAQEEEPPITPTPEAGSSDIDSYLRENLGTPFADLRVDAQNYLLSTPYQNLSVDGQAYASEHFGEIIVARRDAAATPTPEAGRTLVAQVPTETPIPRTEVAVLPANANSLEFMMNGYPNRAAFTSNWRERINVELDFTNNQLMGNDGRPLVPGIHYLRPQNLDPTVLNREYNINGADVEQLLLVGFITFEPSPEVGIVVYLNVPMQVVNPDGSIETSADQPQYGRFFWSPGSMVNIRAVREDGTVIPAPESFNDGPIPGGRDPNSNVFFDKFSQTISFPTAEGVVTVRNGQEVGISIIKNVEDVAPDISRQNGNRTVDQIIQDMMNTNPQDDGVAFIYDVGVIVSR